MIIGYIVVGFMASILLVRESILFQHSDTEKPMTAFEFMRWALLYLLVIVLFWPVIILIILGDIVDQAKRFVREYYDHYRYFRMSDAEKITNLFKIYRVFKYYRPQAREEKLLRATADLYFTVMKWRFVQSQSAMKILELRIGADIVSLKDLAKAILVLKKPFGRPLSDVGYEEDFRAISEKDKTIELFLSELTKKVVSIHEKRKGGHLHRSKK